MHFTESLFLYLTETVLKWEIKLVCFVHGVIARVVFRFLGTLQRSTPSIDMNVDEFRQHGYYIFPPANCFAIRHKLDYQSLILRVFLFLPSQLSISSSELVDYFAQLVARLRMLKNLSKLSIQIRNVRVQSECHWETEEVLQWFEVRSDKSCLALEIEINIELTLLSFNWEIRQLDTSMMEYDSRKIFRVPFCPLIYILILILKIQNSQ